LDDVDSFVIIEYIKSSIEILMSIKYEEHAREMVSLKKKLEKKIDSPKSEASTSTFMPKDYEEML
jgi:hypothetical protein